MLNSSKNIEGENNFFKYNILTPNISYGIQTCWKLK